MYEHKDKQLDLRELSLYSFILNTCIERAHFNLWAFEVLCQGQRSMRDYAIDFRVAASRSGWPSAPFADVFLHGLADHIRVVNSLWQTLVTKRCHWTGSWAQQTAESSIPEWGQFAIVSTTAAVTSTTAVVVAASAAGYLSSQGQN